MLSPPSFVRPADLVGGDSSPSAALGENELPWERGGGGRPGARLYDQVILGSIALEPPVQSVACHVWRQSRGTATGAGRAALALVILDRDGRPVESPAVGISSFGWGVMTALQGDLAALAHWKDVERRLTETIEHALLGPAASAPEDDGRPGPITRDRLMAAYRVLVDSLKLPDAWLEPPSIAVRSYVHFRDSNPPEPLLLNSFYLEDLAAARDLLVQESAPQTLRRYLGVERPDRRMDLLNDRSALDLAVAPAITPLARWPGPARHPLALLQQAAVNVALSGGRTDPVLGINGPPGTGETTLLRDLVAGVVAERAEALAQFDDPEKAFDHSGQQLRAGNAWIHLYRLHSSIRGFEMVVASSNNRAVENVSSELPGVEAIAADADDLRYLATLSDGLLKRDTWGTIAAVLGNMQNRARFRQTFWWDDDTGLNTYLATIVGSPRKVQVTDPQTGIIVERQPRIVTQERPPRTHEEALVRWRRARKRFLEAIKRGRESREWLEGLRGDLLKLPSLKDEQAAAESTFRIAEETAQFARTSFSDAQSAETDQSRRASETAEAVRTSRRVPTGILVTALQKASGARLGDASARPSALMHSKLRNVGPP